MYPQRIGHLNHPLTIRGTLLQSGRYTRLERPLGEGKRDKVGFASHRVRERVACGVGSPICCGSNENRDCDGEMPLYGLLKLALNGCRSAGGLENQIAALDVGLHITAPHGGYKRAQVSHCDPVAAADVDPAQQANIVGGGFHFGVPQKRLTAEAQRPGDRSAWIATTTHPPCSLERLTMCHHRHPFSTSSISKTKKSKSDSD
jgi:hypothetical protein